MPDDTQPADLPNAELEVLALLWQRGSATAREVQDGLAEHRPMTDGATVTLLRRLEARGLVRRHKPPRKQFIYQPTRKARPAYRQLVRRMVDRVFGGDRTQLIVSLFDGRPPSDDELDRIEQALREARARKRPSA